jgi:5-methylcytosine-specific restriction endonuclease McrA
MISLEDDIVQSMERATMFSAFLTSLSAPTKAQLWLEQAAANLERQRDPEGEKKARRDKLVIKLLERDGSGCWYCTRPLNGDVTLEHLQPLALNGNWGEGNLVLAHRGCNKAAGHLSRIKKEAMRDELQSTRSTGAANNRPVTDK